MCNNIVDVATRTRTCDWRCESEGVSVHDRVIYATAVVRGYHFESHRARITPRDTTLCTSFHRVDTMRSMHGVDAKYCKYDICAFNVYLISGIDIMDTYGVFLTLLSEWFTTGIDAYACAKSGVSASCRVPRWHSVFGVYTSQALVLCWDYCNWIHASCT